MLAFDRLSIKSKLILLLLCTNACSIGVVSYLGYTSARDAMTQASFDHLTSVRSTKADEIRLYFEQIRRHMQVLGEDRMLIDAVRDFQAAFRELPSTRLPPDLDARLTTYYRHEFLPRLRANIEGEPVLESYKPHTTASSYLQYHYLVANPNPPSQRAQLDRAAEGSRYGDVHQRYHPALRALMERLGYYDVLLIDAQTGDVLYTVQKEVDFATNLLTGPYRDTNLARLVQQVREEPDRGAVRFADFKSYRPSYAAPAAFVATPLYDGSQLVGLLVLQLSVEAINDVMTSHQHWKRNGLGDTGETYLVGHDLRMRSSSRFLLEDPEGYARAQLSLGVPEQVVRAITGFGNSILLQKVDTEAVRQALRGQEGTRIMPDYRGIQVLSSYAPMHIEGLDWAILAEVDLKEIERPVREFQRRVVVLVVVLVVLLTLFALYASYASVRPLRTLIEAVRRVGEGHHDVKVELAAEDELGELTRACTLLFEGIRQQAESIERKSQENEALLLHLLPGPIARRIQGGEQRIVESVPQATVLFASVCGFTESTEERAPEEAAALLGQIIDAVEEAAERHGVEWIRMAGGGNLVAACGVTVPRLDHVRRVADLVLELQGILQRINLVQGTRLGLRAGIDCGPVRMGIVGTRRMRYDLWGQALSTTRSLCLESPPDTLLVTPRAWERLRDTYELEAAGEAWALRARRAAQESAQGEQP